MQSDMDLELNYADICTIQMILNRVHDFFEYDVAEEIIKLLSPAILKKSINVVQVYKIIELFDNVIEPRNDNENNSIVEDDCTRSNITTQDYTYLRKLNKIHQMFIQWSFLQSELNKEKKFQVHIKLLGQEVIS